MSWKQLAGLILYAAELMLVSGAEIHRVEETADRMGRAAGFARIETFATPTGIFMTLVCPDGDVYTRVRRIRRSQSDLARIAAINDLSRQLAQGQVGFAEAAQALDKIENTPTHAWWQFGLAGGGGSAAFAYLLGGTLLTCALAAVSGCLVVLLTSSIDKSVAPTFLISAFGAALAAVLGIIASLLLPISRDTLILAGVMVLVPGITITTALRDMLTGELVSGVARGAEAMTIAVAVAVGVAFVLGIGGV